MNLRTFITGFAVVLVIMSLIGGFSAFLRHYILLTPNTVDRVEIILQEHINNNKIHYSDGIKNEN